MLNFNIYPGYVKCDKYINPKMRKPFALDLSKFPSLFIDYNDIISASEDWMDDVTQDVVSRCKSFDPDKDRVKCVAMDGFEVVYNTIIEPGTYRRYDRKTMMKRLNTIVTKIYEDYLKRPDDFIPHTRYIISVCRIGGLEEELFSLMSKLGPIGVYLIMSDDRESLKYYPNLFANLYGKLTFNYFGSHQNTSMLKYDENYFKDCELPQPEYVYTLERFRLQHQKYPIIYPSSFYGDSWRDLPRIRQHFIQPKNILKPVQAYDNIVYES